MVDAEFEQIWQQLEHEASHEDDSADAMAKIEAERPDYRRIAERRVRLGLLLSEIGQQGGVAVTQAEMNRLIAQEASRYPNEQQQVVKYFQENAMAAAQLRAPLYEDKVVDYLIGKAAITERSVTREALTAEIESDDETPGGHVHGPDCGHDHDDTPAIVAKPAKAPRAKKPKAGEIAAEPAAVEPQLADLGPASPEATLSDEPVAAVAAKPKRAKKPAEPAA